MATTARSKRSDTLASIRHSGMSCSSTSRWPEMTGFELLDRIGGDASLDAVPAIVLTSAILTSAERQRLRRAARIMSKSDLSGSGLTGAISSVLGGLPSETV